MTYEGGVTSVNVVSAVSLKTSVIGAEMEHPGPVMILQSGACCCLFLKVKAYPLVDYN